jgi:hypothetical protein
VGDIGECTGHWDEYGVVNNRPDVVEVDPTNGGAAQVHSNRNVEQRVLHQHYISSFDSNLGASADRNPNIRLRQRRRIV